MYLKDLMCCLVLDTRIEVWERGKLLFKIDEWKFDINKISFDDLNKKVSSIEIKGDKIIVTLKFLPKK